MNVSLYENNKSVEISLKEPGNEIFDFLGHFEIKTDNVFILDKRMSIAIYV